MFKISRQLYELRVMDHNYLLTNNTNNTHVIVMTRAIFVNIYNDRFATFFTRTVCTMDMHFCASC